MARSKEPRYPQIRAGDVRPGDHIKTPRFDVQTMRSSWDGYAVARVEPNTHSSPLYADHIQFVGPGDIDRNSVHRYHPDAMVHVDQPDDEGRARATKSYDEDWERRMDLRRRGY